jgi:hypothetical protein
MKDEYAQLRRVTRSRLGLIWELAQAGGELDGEDARLAAVLKQHPEYTDVWEEAQSMGKEEVTRDGVNPFVHVAIHQVVENQLAENDPPQTAETLEALLRAGYERHNAIHAIGRVVSDEIFAILKEKRPFDEGAYMSALEDLARTETRRPRRGRRGRGGRRGRRR